MNRRSFLKTLGAIAAAVLTPTLPAVPAPVGHKLLKYTVGPGGDFSSLAACMEVLNGRNLIAENLSIEVQSSRLPDDGGPVRIELPVVHRASTSIRRRTMFTLRTVR
jgi:hypothetical protein